MTKKPPLEVKEVGMLDPISELLAQTFKADPTKIQQLLDSVKHTQQVWHQTASLRRLLADQEVTKIADKIIGQYKTGHYEVSNKRVQEAIQWLDLIFSG